MELPVGGRDEQSQDASTKAGNVRVNEYLGKLSSTTSYAVLQMVFPAGTMSGLDENARMQLIYSLLNFEHGKGEVMGPLTLAVVDDYPGIIPPAFRTDYTSDTYKNEVLIFVHIDDIYMLMGQHSPNEDHSAEIKAFCQSFRLGG